MASGNSHYGSKKFGSGREGDIGRYFRWWRDELAELIPPRLRPYPRPSSKFVWIEFKQDHAVLFRVKGGKLEEIGSLGLMAQDAVARKLAFNVLLGSRRKSSVGIALPPAMVLRKDVKLPFAVKENLRQVLEFELGRFTPFSSEQVYFDYRESGSDAKGGLVLLKLVLSERRAVDLGIMYLKEWGVVPHAIVPKDELVSEVRYADLLPASQRPGMGGIEKTMYAVMALVTFVLLGLALAVPMWQKREVVIALNKQAAQTRMQAEAVEQLQQTLDKSQAEYRYLLVKKSTQPAKVALIEELTRLLPDDVWLSSLEVKGTDVVISGEAKSATGLIRIMEKSKLLQDAAFSSPVVKERSDLERFQLAAKIRGADSADASATKVKANDAPLALPGMVGSKSPGNKAGHH